MSENLDRLAAAPRGVPLRLGVALRLGGINGLIGWIFLAFTMVFVTVLTGVGDFGRSLALQGATLVPVPGVGLGWEETATEVNEKTVVANFAEYRVAGARFECSGYALERGLTEGEPVVVEYSPLDPALCRIVGMDTSAMPWWVLAILLPFLLIGAGFAFSRWRHGGRLIRALRHGRLAWAEQISKEDTNVRINDAIQWRYTFRFEDERGRSHEVVGRTTDEEALEDEPREAVLYDPVRPDVAVLADTEPGLLRVDARGRWRAPPLGRVIGLLIAPTVAVILVALTILLF